MAKSNLQKQEPEKKRTDVFLTVEPLPLPIRLVSVQLTVVFFKQRDQYLN